MDNPVFDERTMDSQDDFACSAHLVMKKAAANREEGRQFNCREEGRQTNRLPAANLVL